MHTTQRFSVLFAVLLAIGSFGNLHIQSALAADATAEIREALRRLDPHVFPPEKRDSQRTMVGRHLRAQIAKANAASTAEWKAIRTREDWEVFRGKKLKLLSSSLSRQEFVPGSPNVACTGTIQGAGFRIEKPAALLSW